MKNRYGTELTDVRATLAQSEIFCAVLSSAIKRNKFLVHITGCEKVNHATKENHWGRDQIPNPDGHYDTEGHEWTDIHGTYWLSPFKKSDIKQYFSDIKSWWKDVMEFWNVRHPSSAIRFALDTIGVFWVRRSQWCWTVESSETFIHTLVDEKLTAFYGLNEAFEASEHPLEYGRKLREFMEQTTHEEIMKYIQANYLQINRFMWVQPNDPSVIVIDKEAETYDMKSGYSNLKLLTFLHIWLWWITDKRIEFYESRRFKWLN